MNNKNEISKIDKIICILLRKIRGSKKIPEIIIKRSYKKYGKNDCLSRYWFEKFYNIKVGKYTYGFYNITNDYIKEIGSFTSIASNVIIVPNDHKMDWVTTSPILAMKDFGFVKKDINMEYCPKEKRATIIGNDVWIGANCVIFEGVKIGDGAVLAAGSIIRKDVPPYAIVAGVDRVIKYRFSKEIIEELLKIRWWNWDDNTILKNVNMFYNPEKFVKKYEVKI